MYKRQTDNHIWISNDVIRNARLQKGLTQHQACEGIIEPETLSLIHILPKSGAVVGAAGARIISYFSNALSNSCLISAFVFNAFK